MSQVDTKERLLGAACRIVGREGPASLTLDAVAAEARVSKGGVLYHFSSKSALLSAMIAQLLEAFEADIARALQTEPPGPGHFLRAYIRASLRQPEGMEDATSAILVAAFTDPALLDEYRLRAQDWRRKATADGTDPIVAQAIMYAADGLFMDDLFKVEAPSPKTRVRLVELLMNWARGAQPQAEIKPEESQPSPSTRRKTRASKGDRR